MFKRRHRQFARRAAANGNSELAHIPSAALASDRKCLTELQRPLRHCLFASKRPPIKGTSSCAKLKEAAKKARLRDFNPADFGRV
jgi:hypothetical protein